MSKKVALVLLAAGNSIRFGTDKLYYPIHGVPMLSRSLRLYGTEAEAGMLDPRFLVIQPGHEALEREAEQLGYRVLYNDVPEKGISHSIHIGVHAAMESCPDGVLFSVADQPFLKKETVRRLMEAFEQNTDRIIVPTAEGIMGNPVLFAARFLPEFASLNGDRGGKLIIRNHPESVISVETDQSELQDIDTRPEVGT